jgi:hypothetical protein
MRNRGNVLALLLSFVSNWGGVVLAVINFGCGGGTSSHNNHSIVPPTVSVSISQGTSSLQAEAATQITATVANDSTNKGLSWTVACPIAPCGTLSPTTTASGAATTYTAPTNLPSGGMTVTITAHSISDTSASAFATIMLVGNDVQALTITTTSVPNGTVNVPYSTTLKSSGGAPPVTWVLGTGTAPPPGLSLSGDGIISGTPTVPGSVCFDVIALDSSAVQQFPSIAPCIGINASDSSHNSLLNGHYAFVISGLVHLSEWPTRVMHATAGSFVADGHGNLTSGVSESDNNGVITTDRTFIGTYALGNDNRGTLTLNYNNSFDVVTLAFSAGTISLSGVATKGSIVNFTEPGVTSGGELDLQDLTALSSAAISGSYAFALTGSGAIQKQFSADGVFTSDGAGNISNGMCDEYINGALTFNDSVTGTYKLAAGSTTGRGTASLTIAGTTFNLTFYAISMDKLLIVSADQTINSIVFLGQAQKQSDGPFNNASLKGTSVFSPMGAASINDVAIGLATFDGTSTLTWLQDENEAGSVTLNKTGIASYNVSNNGRATEIVGGSAVSVLYLVSPGKGFILNTDSNASVGFMEPQSPGPFTNSSINGTFFFGATPVSGAVLSSGVTALNSGIINQTSDINQPLANRFGETGSFVYDQASMDTYTVSANGRVTTGSGKEVFYVVSPTKFVVIDVNPTDVAPFIKFAEK